MSCEAVRADSLSAPSPATSNTGMGCQDRRQPVELQTAVGHRRDCGCHAAARRPRPRSRPGRCPAGLHALARAACDVNRGRSAALVQARQGGRKWCPRVHCLLPEPLWRVCLCCERGPGDHMLRQGRPGGGRGRGCPRCRGRQHVPPSALQPSILSRNGWQDLSHGRVASVRVHTISMAHVGAVRIFPDHNRGVLYMPIVTRPAVTARLSTSR